MNYPQEPEYIELEPEKAPRTSAIILLICGLMGVGFLMVNVVFTGEDPFQNGWWPEQAEEGAIQEQFNVIPNVWRGRGADDEEEALDEQIQARKTTGSRATTNPFQQLPGFESLYPRPGFPTPPAPPGYPGTGGAGTGTGAPGTPGVAAPPK